MKKPESPKAMRLRHEEQLTKAWMAFMLPTTPVAARVSAAWDYRKIRAVVYATTPGRQKARNIGSQLDKAVTAACRVIRRRR